MKLNKYQKHALLMWLGSKIPRLYSDHSVVHDIDAFCNGEITEWRIIYNLGMAGKIWNVHDKIYVTHGEIGAIQYKKQQKMIDQWNEELEKLLLIFS